MPCSGIDAGWGRGRELRKAQLFTSIIEDILLKFRKWFKYGLKAQFQKQHALKGQKLLAQGSALGIMSVSNAPCKGKSFKIHLIKMEKPLRYVKLLPLQGDRFAFMITQGAALGYELLPFQGVLLIGAFSPCQPYTSNHVFYSSKAIKDKEEKERVYRSNHLL